MRRISFTRPNEKVRGAKRRLKEIDDWADSYDEFIPMEWCSEQYIDLKLPTLDRLVNPPTTKPEWQEHAIKAMFRALEKLNASKPKELSSVPIDLILTWPNLSESTITIFFDKDYHSSFYEKDEEWQKRKPLKITNNEIPFQLPSNISVKKVEYMNRDYDGNETTEWYKEDWYVCTIKNS